MASTQERYASKQQRRRILILQDFRCALCGADLECECDIDHIVPFSAGGSTTLQNLQALCKHCHKSKTRLDGSRLQRPSCVKGNGHFTNASAPTSKTNTL
ncbi:MAG: HNH endonuclease [bacterium]